MKKQSGFGIWILLASMLAAGCSGGPKGPLGPLVSPLSAANVQPTPPLNTEQLAVLRAQQECLRQSGYLSNMDCYGVEEIFCSFRPVEGVVATDPPYVTQINCYFRP